MGRGIHHRKKITRALERRIHGPGYIVFPRRNLKHYCHLAIGLHCATEHDDPDSGSLRQTTEVPNGRH